jgi:hypothetical protein
MSHLLAQLGEKLFSRPCHVNSLVHREICQQPPGQVCPMCDPREQTAARPGSHAMRVDSYRDADIRSFQSGIDHSVGLFSIEYLKPMVFDLGSLGSPKKSTICLVMSSKNSFSWLWLVKSISRPFSKEPIRIPGFPSRSVAQTSNIIHCRRSELAGARERETPKHQQSLSGSSRAAPIRPYLPPLSGGEYARACPTSPFQRRNSICSVGISQYASRLTTKESRYPQHLSRSRIDLLCAAFAASHISLYFDIRRVTLLCDLGSIPPRRLAFVNMPRLG